MTQDDAHRSLLPLATSLPGTADAAFDRIAGLTRTVLGTPVALVSLVDRHRQVFPGAAGLPEPWHTERQTPLSHSFCQYVVARQEPLVVDDARSDPLLASNLAIPDLGVIAYAGMPLRDAEGRVIGSLCAIDTEPRQWTSSELDLLSDLAHTCSAELQLREAADRAEHAADRARLLLELSEVLSSATTVGQVGRLVSNLARRRLGASFGGVSLHDGHAGELRYLDLGAFEDIVHRPGTFGIGDDRPTAIAVRTRQALFLHTPDELAAVSPGTAEAVRATGATSFAYLPMHLGEDILGAVSFIWDTAQPFTHDDRELLIGFTRYAAGALHRAMLLSDRRDVAATLQQAMLPTLPTLDWVEVGGVYRPASAADAVGGDWYDAFLTAVPDQGDATDPATPADTQRLTVVVGDVTGHDTAAAAVMGRLQAGLRHLAIDAPCNPGELLGRLDRVMAGSPDDPSPRMATAVTGNIRVPVGGVGTAEFSWSNAGHLPPLLLAPGEPPRYLDAPVDLLLGLDPTFRRRSQAVPLPAGSTVLLFTDGMVERRDADLDHGLEVLRQASDVHRGLALADFLTAVVDAVMAGSHDDDAVLLGIRLPAA